MKICTCIFDTLKVQFAKNITDLYRLNGPKYCLENNKLISGKEKRMKRHRRRNGGRKGEGEGWVENQCDYGLLF